jgi:hypothetical protein
MAGTQARNAVIGEFLQRQQLKDQARRADIQQDLQRRQFEASIAPKPVDPLERMAKMQALEKGGYETALKKQELERSGKTDEYKQTLVDLINTSGKVGNNAASMAMSLKTLESIAKDVGLSELDLKKARAAGGISGRGVGGTGISRTEAPKLATAVEKAMAADAQYLDDPNEQEALTILSRKPKISPAEAKLRENLVEKSAKNKDRMIEKADKWIGKFSDSNSNEKKMFSAIRNLKSVIAKYQGGPGWGKVTSTFENAGEFGQWLIDLKNINDPAAKEMFRAVRRYKESYGRDASGAAIGQTEWTNFSRQLGAGAFTNIQDLIRGVETAERLLKQAVSDAYIANVAEPLRNQSEWAEPMQPYLLSRYKSIDPNIRADSNAVANKYKGQ